MNCLGPLLTLWGLPPDIVKSSPPIATERPSISPSPMTNAPGVNSVRLPSSSNSAAPTIGPASKKLPGSNILSIRSRMV